MSSNELEVLEHYNRKIQKYLDVQNAEEVLLKWVKISLTQYRRWKLPHQSCYIIIVPEMIHITPSWLTSSTNTHLLSDFNTYLTTFNHLDLSCTGALPSSITWEWTLPYSRWNFIIIFISPSWKNISQPPFFSTDHRSGEDCQLTQEEVPWHRGAQIRKSSGQNQWKPLFQIGSLSRDLVAKWKDIVTREEEREELEEGVREEGGGGREVNILQRIFPPSSVW